MTIFRVYDLKSMDKWLAQNEAEAIDCVEGCLLDNAWYECRRGETFIFEEFVNSWTSDFLCYFFKASERESQEYKRILKRFEILQEAMALAG